MVPVFLDVKKNVFNARFHLLLDACMTWFKKKKIDSRGIRNYHIGKNLLHVLIFAQL